jgi:hypothetical protein
MRVRRRVVGLAEAILWFMFCKYYFDIDIMGMRKGGLMKFL